MPRIDKRWRLAPVLVVAALSGRVWAANGDVAGGGSVGGVVPILVSSDPFSGSATSSYTFSAPPGRSGMAPDLRITYNSSSGSPGIMGRGWSFTTPMIQRSTRLGQPKFDWTDTFTLTWQGRALDLMMISDPGTGVREYRTQIETFMRIKSYSIPPSLTYWEVEDGKGRVYQFGNDGGSGTWVQVSDSKWALNKVQDSFGNYLKMDWIIDNGTLYPSVILYAGNSITNLPTTNKVEFSYQGRYDVTDNHLGMKSSLAKSQIFYRLRRVETWAGTQVASLYLLDYTTPYDSEYGQLNNLCSTSSCGVSSTVCADGSIASCNNSCDPSTGFCLPCTPVCPLCAGVNCGTTTITCPDGLQYGCSNSCDPSTGQCIACTPQCPSGGGGGGGGHHGGATVATTQASFGTNDGPSLLTRITRYDGGGQTSLPPTSFTYLTDQTSTKSWGTPTSDIPIAFSNSTSLRGGAEYVQDLGVQIADVNRDGLPDLIQAKGYDSSGCGPSQRGVYINTGGTWTYDPTSTWSTSVPQDFTIHLCGQDADYDNGLRVVDINGDGLEDLVQSVLTSVGGTPVTYVYLNTGSGWALNTSVAWSAPAFVHNESSTKEDLGMRFGDVNGDGLVDIVEGRDTSCPSTSRHVYLNNGSGWALQTGWNVPEMFVYHYCGKGSVDTGVRLLDVNGDGLADIVKSVNRDGTLTQAVWLNRGAPDSNGNVWELASDWPLPNEPITIWSSKNQNSDDWGVRFADVNGDGRTDWVVANNYKTSTGGDNIYKAVYLHRGGKGWALDSDFSSKFPTIFVTHFYGGEDYDDGARLVDTDGNSTIDVVQSQTGDLANTNARSMSADVFSDLLSGSTNGIGGSMSLSYVSSATLDNHADGAPAGAPSNLGFVTPVLSQATSSDGQAGAGHTFVTNYSRRGGFYHYPRREFRGFRYARTDLPGGIAYTEDLFVQDTGLDLAPLAGSTERHALRRVSDNAVFSMDLNTYDRTDALKPIFHWLKRTDNYLYEWGVNLPIACPPGTTACTTLSSSGAKKNVAVSYDYTFDGNGQIASHVVQSLGDVSTDTDDLTETMSFANDATQWRVGYLTQDLLSDPSAVALAESWYYYDNKSLGQVGTLCEVTKMESWSGQTGDGPGAAANRTTTYSYGDAYGHITSAIDGASHQTNYDYGITDATFTFLDRVRAVTTGGGTQVNHEIDLSYDPRFGKIAREAVTGSSPVQSEFDSFGRPTRLWTSLDSEALPTACYQYNLSSQPIMIGKFEREVSGLGETCGSSGMLSSVSFHDGLGREIEAKTEAADPLHPSDVVRTVVYDARGQVQAVTSPYLSSDSMLTYSVPSGSAPIASFTYDEAGRQHTVTAPGVPTAITTYDGWTRIDVDPEGKQKQIDADSAGRTVQSRTYDSSGNLYTTTLMQYSRLGQLRFVTNAADPNHPTEFRYNSFGERVVVIDPDVGQSTWAFNGDGTIAQTTDPQNRSTSYTYDELGRPLQAIRSNATTVTYRYDEAAGGAGAIGRLTSLFDSETSVAQNFTYDTLGRAITTQETIPGIGTYMLAETYDALGRATSMTYPDSSSVTYQYGTDGRVSSVPGFVQGLSYSASGHLAQIQYANGVIETDSYDATTDWLTNITAQASSGVTVASLTYGYSPGGYLLQVNDLVGTSSQTFGLDHLYRLKCASAPSSYGTLAYQYDVLGNMTLKDSTSCTSGGGGTGFNFGNASHPHQATSTTTGLTFLYDGSGNLTSALGAQSKGRTYDYNLDGHLAHMLDTQAGSESWYTYDPQGSRVKRVDQVGVAQPTITIFLGDLYEASGSTFTKYVYAADRRVAEWRNDGSKDFYTSDHGGNTTVVTDNSGNVVKRIEYKPYGETSAVSGGSFSANFMFGDSRRDQQTGLYDFGARFYDPTLGRFLTADPIIADATDPNMASPYSYARGNPTSFRDYGGLSAGDIGFGGTSWFGWFGEPVPNGFLDAEDEYSVAGTLPGTGSSLGSGSFASFGGTTGTPAGFGMTTPTSTSLGSSSLGTLHMTSSQLAAAMSPQEVPELGQSSSTPYDWHLMTEHVTVIGEVDQGPGPLGGLEDFRPFFAQNQIATALPTNFNYVRVVAPSPTTEHVEAAIILGPTFLPMEAPAGSLLGAGFGISEAARGAGTVERGLEAAGPIARSLGAASRSEAIAKRLGLNINSPTTRQVLNNLDMKVTDFIGKFRAGGIRARFPSEFLDKSVEDALTKGGSTVRKLLIDRDYIK